MKKHAASNKIISHSFVRGEKVWKFISQTYYKDEFCSLYAFMKAFAKAVQHLYVNAQYFLLSIFSMYKPEDDIQQRILQ